MLNVESKLWKVVAYNDGGAGITQKASRVTRYVSRGKLPSADACAAMSENRFNAIVRDLFHEAAHD